MSYLGWILAYLGALTLMGIVLSRRVRGQEDFMVAGRKLGASVLVGTLLATWMGAGSLLGAAGLAYRQGLAALWFSAGAWIGIAVLYFVASRARRLALYTVPDLLELRYHVAARVLGALTTVVAYTAITSYQYRAGGTVLSLVTDLTPEQGRWVTAAFVIGLTVVAGMVSVAYTDLVQGIVMTAGVLITFPVLLRRAGGWASVRAALPASHFTVFGTLSAGEAVAYLLPSLLLLLGEANMYQRFFSARDERTARRAVAGWIGGTIVLETLIALTAVVGSALYPEIAGRSETVLLYAIRHGLPFAVGFLLLAAGVSMIISTADAFLLVPTTNVVRDIYQRFLRPQAGPREIVLVSRLVAVGLGVLAYLQLEYFSGVLEAAMYAYTVYGAGLTPAILAAFFWKRATPAGGVASIAGSMIVTIAWQLLGGEALCGRLFPALAALGLCKAVYPALATSLALLIGVSLAGRPPEPARWRAFFAGGDSPSA